MILLYHSVIPDNSHPERLCVGQALPQSSFERQVRWLKNYCSVVSLAEYMASIQQPEFKQCKPVAITFDDGFDMTFRCVSPFLIEMNIPATFFVTTGHLEYGELLWFSYLKALCFEHQYKSVGVDRSVFYCKPRNNVNKRGTNCAYLPKQQAILLNFAESCLKNILWKLLCLRYMVV